MSHIKVKVIIISSLFLLARCDKEDIIYLDSTRSIEVTDNISVDNGIVIRDPVFNYVTYDNFLKYIANSDRFLVVQQKDFENTNSTDKVVISLRHDVDDNINSAIKFAYLEKKYEIKSSYYFLHTASYYGKTMNNSFTRDDNLIHFIKKIQESFGHEAGFHNDLVTLQIMYGLDSREFLKGELEYLRANGIRIYGTTSHGSDYCYIYHYVNSYFWDEILGSDSGNFYNWEYITKGYKKIKILKDKLSNYDLLYEAYYLHPDYFFSDSDWPEGKRWHMGMVNLDTIKPGKKVIMLIHPQHWEQ